FSSRRRHTRFSRDWSSDVCSSDLLDDLHVSVERRNEALVVSARLGSVPVGRWIACPEGTSISEQVSCYEYLKSLDTPGGRLGKRSEERRVGKESGSRRAPEQ